MRKAAFIFLSLAAASSAKAAPMPGFCDDLRAMIASVRDTPPFASVTRIVPAPPLALLRNCIANNVGFSSEVTCTWHRQSQAAPAIEELVAEAVRCLPGARRRGDAIVTAELLAVTIARDPNVPHVPGDGVRVTVAVPEG